MRVTLFECGRDKTSRRRAALWLLVRELPGWVALNVALALVSAAFPAIFALLIALLVTRLPDAIRSGDFDTGIISVLVGVAIVLTGQEIAAAAHDVGKWAFYRRYEEYLLARVMRATLSARELDLFENPERARIADRAVRIAALEPGDLVDGYCCKWAVVAQGLAAAVLVGTVWPIAAGALAVMWLCVGRQLQVGLLRADRYVWTDAWQHEEYVRQVAMRAEWAKEVRVFGLTEWLADRYGLHWRRLLRQMDAARRVDHATMAVAFTAVIAGNAAVLGFAVHDALAGGLSVGRLTVLLQGLVGMAFLADQMADNLVEYGASRPPVVRDLEAAVAAAPARPLGTQLADRRPSREISFTGVRFAYPNSDVAVFDGLDLSIKAGTSVGIVGLNGAGKTTLIKLLVGLETPQQGRITVDGIDLADVDPASWRQCVAAIFQDFVRYEMPARDNVGFGAVDELHGPRIDELVTAAAVRTGADKVLAGLPYGLQTTLSRRFSGGVDLSGGQWQRVALARAMAAVAHGARVLVLDEPTAQLDVRAEADIYNRFLDLSRDLTTIVISHRFSTVRRADRIIVLDAGRVSEDGSHEELIAAGGEYARLFAKQAMRYVDPGEADA